MFYDRIRNGLSCFVVNPICRRVEYSKYVDARDRATPAGGARASAEPAVGGSGLGSRLPERAAGVRRGPGGAAAAAHLELIWRRSRHGGLFGARA